MERRRIAKEWEWGRNKGRGGKWMEKARGRTEEGEIVR